MFGCLFGSWIYQPGKEKNLKGEKMSKRKPHKHADLIKQWADGASIQIYSNKWEDIESPQFNEEYKYRVKPEQWYLTVERGMEMSGWIGV